MIHIPARRAGSATVLSLLVLALGACGTSGATSTGTASSPSAPAPSPPAQAEAAASPVPDQPFGAACGAIPAAGEGSFAGMSDDPVAVAMANNPVVTALAAAIRAAHLAAPLDSQREVTVLAPANLAFEHVPHDALGALLADTPRLTAVLTHHVLQGRLAPEALAGTHTTLNNDQVTIDVSPDAFTVAAEGTLLGGTEARVICGNMRTANATVYLIDQVLAPPD